MKHKKHTILGLSGGVDSAVSAYLLKKQGYQVTALFMKNWNEDDEDICSAEKDWQDAFKTAEQLNIPCYKINLGKQYYDLVFTRFLKDLAKGLTPNPDILCNQYIKFYVFYNYAKKMGADYLATGHYCQIKKINDQYFLAKGADSQKDQSYFLYHISSKIFPTLLFPIGHLNKKQVREIAREKKLIVSEKKDSTGICFITPSHYKDFVAKYLNKKKGHFKNLKGEIVGTHDGHIFYTIGQRKGLRLGGQGDPWFVVDKNPKDNIVYVNRGERPLFSKSLIAKDFHGLTPKHEKIFNCQAKIRYRGDIEECQVNTLKNNTLSINFKNPVKAVTPGQSIVFYQNDICLGGANIIS